jgi:hypothetical protein
LIEEDYTLLNIQDPDEHSSIELKKIYPDDRLSKEAIELVEIDQNEIKKHEAEEKKAQI